MRRDESRYRGKGSMRAELDREGLPRKRSASFQLEVILAPWHRDAGWRSRGCIREYDRVVSTETRCKLRFAFGTMFEPGSIQLACVSTCRETSHLQPAVFTKRSNLSSSLRSLSLSLSLSLLSNNPRTWTENCSGLSSCVFPEAEYIPLIEQLLAGYCCETRAFILRLRICEWYISMCPRG